MAFAEAGSTVFMGGTGAIRSAGTATLRAEAEAVVANNVGPLRFTQTTASPMFSEEGAFAGRRVADVAADLRTGVMTPSQVPVEFVVQDGNSLIVNTRSSLALQRAGVPQSEWTLIDKTSVPEVQARITERLLRNQLDTSGTSTLRITGSGKNASTIH